MAVDLKNRVARAYITLLSAQNALEVWLAMTAIVWGLLVFQFGNFMTVGYNRRLDEVMSGHANFIGLYIAAVGFLGLFSPLLRWRVCRSCTSLLAAFFWGFLTVFFSTRTPPVSSAAAIYGMLSVAEVWVYVRVSGYFDPPR